MGGRGEEFCAFSWTLLSRGVLGRQPDTRPDSEGKMNRCLPAPKGKLLGKGRGKGAWRHSGLGNCPAWD